VITQHFPQTDESLMIIERLVKQEEWLMSRKHTEMMWSKNKPHQTWLWTQSLQDSPAPSTWLAASPCGPCCCNTVSQTADEKDQSRQPSPGSCHQSYSKYRFHSKLHILMHTSSKYHSEQCSSHNNMSDMTKRHDSNNKELHVQLYTKNS